MPRLLSSTLNCCVKRLSQSARGRESHPLGVNEFSSCGLLLVNKCENLLEQFLHCHQLAPGNTHTVGSLLQPNPLVTFIVLSLHYCFLNRLDPPVGFLVG